MIHRFAILRHDHPFWHWDLLVESAGKARAWRLLRQPCRDEPIAIQSIADHRLFYLDYEGPVSENRGHVIRVFHGTCRVRFENSRALLIELAETKPASLAIIRRLKDGREFIEFTERSENPEYDFGIDDNKCRDER